MAFLHQLLRMADNSIIFPGIMEDIILLIIAGQKKAVLFGFPDQLLSAPIQGPLWFGGCVFCRESGDASQGLLQRRGT